MFEVCVFPRGSILLIYPKYHFVLVMYSPHNPFFGFGEYALCSRNCFGSTSDRGVERFWRRFSSQHLVAARRLIQNHVAQHAVSSVRSLALTVARSESVFTERNSRNPEAHHSVDTLFTIEVGIVVSIQYTIHNSISILCSVLSLFFLFFLFFSL